MPCYRPVTVWKPDDGGPISFRELKDHREMQIACNHCIGCRIMRQEAWAFRCYAESMMHKNNSFVTLTYDNDNVPTDGSLYHRHWQLFAKRLRKKLGPFRFFMCGEYGEKTHRPHYHALLFGVQFPDVVRDNSIFAKEFLGKSELLDKLWGKGHCTIGEVTYQSARYCAGYAVKKKQSGHDDYLTVDAMTGEVTHRMPEYGKMSLKPGIGATWFEKFWPECVAHDGCFVYDRKVMIPHFFDDMLAQIAPERSEELKESRTKKAIEFIENRTRERLEVREKVCQARRKHYERSRYAI